VFRSLQRRIALSLTLLVLAVAGLPLLAGCGGETKAATAVDGIELLDLLQQQDKRHDPKAFVELSLGDYMISRRGLGNDGILVVRFQLFGIVAQHEQEKLTHELPAYEKRIRSAVINLVQATDLDQISDPNLTYIKSEITLATNDVLRGRLFKDVVFSNFSLEREQ
jgi:hypothetical protein